MPVSQQSTKGVLKMVLASHLQETRILFLAPTRSTLKLLMFSGHFWLGQKWVSRGCSEAAFWGQVRVLGIAATCLMCSPPFPSLQDLRVRRRQIWPQRVYRRNPSFLEKTQSQPEKELQHLLGESNTSESPWRFFIAFTLEITKTGSQLLMALSPFPFPTPDEAYWDDWFVSRHGTVRGGGRSPRGAAHHVATPPCTLVGSCTTSSSCPSCLCSAWTHPSPAPPSPLPSPRRWIAAGTLRSAARSWCP